MSDQYQPTAYYDWVNRTHGIHLVTGNYQLVPYDYYAGDELHIQNVVFRNSEYVTYDNTHVRFLNKSDIHVYDTSSLVIHDSGTLTMHTSSAPGARTFIVDEIGRVGIGMNHLGVHSNHPESPSFDLDVRGQVGIEDYIYHNDDTDTYMLFGTDTKTHHVNADGSITPPITPPNQDYDEINFRVGGVDMLQMKEDGTQDQVVINKNQADVDTIIRTSTNTHAVVVSGDGSEVVINGDGNSDTDFRIESDKSEKMLFVDTSTDMITLSGPGAGDDTAIFDIQGNDDDDLTGASLLYVDPTETVLNKGANDHNFRVVAQNLDPQQNTTDTGTDGNVQNHTAALASHALFVDATNGRVGIGHDNPSTTLHVAGSAHIEGDLWVKGVTNQIDTLIHATSAMDITNIGTGPALTVTQSGAQPVAVFWDRDNNDVLQASLFLDDQTKMGIGTSSPAHAVHISDTVESQAGSDLVTMMIDHNYNHGGIGINSTAKDTQNHVRFLSGGDVMWQMRQPLQYNTDPDSLRFTHSSRAFDVITMIPNGDVGIGRQRGTGNYSSAPQYRLQIAGDTTGTQDIVQITTNDTEIDAGQEQGLTFGQGDVSFSKVAGFYQGNDVYGLKLYSCLETSREIEDRGNFRYNDLAGITLLGDNKTGINIEAPTAQLHVYRGDQHETQSGLTVHRGDTSFDARTTAPILNVFNGNAGSTEVFRVQGDGKTGIGTDNPDTALHIQRHFNTGTTAETRTALNSVLTLATTRQTGANHAPFSGFGPAMDFKSVNYDATSANPGPHPIARIAASITNASSTHTGGSLRFFTTPLDTATSTDDLEENMIIMPSGKVGIGTSAPATLLELAADSNVVTGGSDPVAIRIGHTNQDSGNDSYSTDDDVCQLQFYSADASHSSNTGGVRASIGMISESVAGGGFGLTLGTDNGERIRVDSAGNVGIGTSTPDSELEVEGTLHIKSGDGTNAGAVQLIGTIDITNGDKAIVGTNTQFQVDLRPGDLVIINTTDYFVDVISSDTAMTVTQAITNITATGVTPYRKNTREAIFAPGNVGFGTMTPIYNVESFGKVSNTLSFTSNHQDGTRIQHAAIGTNLTGFGRLGLFSDVGNSLIELNSNPGGHSFIHNGGNLGIGTDNPTGKLYVNNGSGNFYSAANDVFRNATTLTNGQHSLIMQSGGWTNAGVLQQVTGATAATTNTFGLYLNSAYGSRAFSSSSIHVNCGQSNGDIRFSTGDGTTNPTEQMTIANNGEVTIHQSLHLGTDLAVAHGGTGVSTLADKAVCVTQDSGTDQVETKVMTTDGALLIGGSNGPETATLTAGTDITITNANNAITIAHSDTSTATSAAVTTGKFVNKISIDVHGHVTDIGTADAPTRASLNLATTDDVQFAALGVGMPATSTAGEIVAAADIIAFSSSDERLKDNVTPISDPIEKLSKIGGYEFDWKDNDECSHTGHDVGVIAQEIEQVLPDIVTTRDSGYKAVKYEKLTALLIEVTKSQQSQIDDLKRQVEQLSK